MWLKIADNCWIRLPPLIRQMTSQEMWDTDETGLSQAAVFCGKKMVLKIEKENSTADQEYHMLSWLQGKLPVPRLLAFERKDGRNYLLMERLSGEMACADSYMEDPARQAEVLANGLRLLWSTDISGCPYPDMTSRKLKLARERVEMGLVSMEGRGTGDPTAPAAFPIPTNCSSGWKKISQRSIRYSPTAISVFLIFSDADRR